MTDDVIFVGTFTIPRDRTEEWRVAIVDMIDFVKANSPRLISFNAYVNEDASEGTVIYHHPDSDSLEQHLEVAASRINVGQQMVRVTRIDVYGAPSERLVERMRRFSEAGGLYPVNVKTHLYGS